MPCFSLQTYQTVLEGIKDINLLKEALEAVGFTVQKVGEKTLRFSGVYSETGQYHSGGYSNEVLTSNAGQLNVPNLKKHIGVANLRKNAKKKGWQLKKVAGSDFKYQLIK